MKNEDKPDTVAFENTGLVELEPLDQAVDTVLVVRKGQIIYQSSAPGDLDSLEQWQQLMTGIRQRLKLPGV